MLLLEAMASEEGYLAKGKSPDRSQRNNNPLDLEWCDETAHFGASHGDPRFAIFPNVAAGWYAAQRWLSVEARFDEAGNLVGGYLGATLRQVIGRFAPSTENNTANYLTFVCSKTGLTPDTVLTSNLLTIPK